MTNLYSIIVITQRRFIRECESDEVATYKSFRIWLDGNSPTDEMWQLIMEQDEQHNYSSNNVEPPAVENEVNVFTSSSGENIAAEGAGPEGDDLDGYGTD